MTGFRRTIVTTTLAVLAAGPAASAGAGDVRIEVLSNRADLVSGGDALVRVSPAGPGLEVAADGRDVTGAFGDDGVGLVDGLRVGANELTARLADGRGARLTITNHPVGGPILAGPQVQPWICNTLNPPQNSGTAPTVVPVGLGPPKDAQCNTEPAVSFVYKSTITGGFERFDPAAPPGDEVIARTTTDEGKTVRYVVRQEFGVQDRGIYAIAVLAEPGAWNRKLLTYFGASTAPYHRQSQPSRVLDDMVLSRGFMAANSSLNVNGQNTNQNVSAEALMMLKEHITERYGRIRYTIGQGCSGGSYQHMIASMYPGLLDGLQPNCSYTDLWTTVPDVFDCGLLLRYFQANPATPWAPAVSGHQDPSVCAAWDALFFSAGDPSREAGCSLPDELTYDPAARPHLVRCTLQDYQQAIWGPRPASAWTPVEERLGRGFANRPWGNAGVQYGLQALEAGQLTAAQFVDLNARIGGLTIDHRRQAERSEVDAATAATAYRTSQVTDARQLATVPIIDLRAWSEAAEIHTSFYSYKLRARLDRDNGTHGNQLIWTFPAAEPIIGVTPPPDIARRSLDTLDRWLAAIERDTSARTRAEKVLANRPQDARDTCFTGAPAPAAPGGPGAPGSVEVSDPAACEALYPSYGNTRTAAGGPVTDDVIQCRYEPLDPADYPVTFTEAQLETLRRTFPKGVCDTDRPGVGQGPSIPWQTFADGPGGRPLGPAPVSTPFGPAAGSPARAGAAPARP